MSIREVRMGGPVNGVGRRDAAATELVEIVLAEELDLAGVSELGVLLDLAVALRPARLVIDVAACRHVDAAGIGLLLDVHRRMWRLGGRLTLRSPSPRLQRLFQVARVDQVLQISHPHVAEDGAGSPDTDDQGERPPPACVAYGRAQVSSLPDVR